MSDPPSGPILTTASEVEPKEVLWWWQNRLPKGKLTEIFGDPGEGKSTLALAITAQLTLGVPLPGDTDGREPRDVIFVSAEDDKEDALVPRLRDLGADRERVHFLDDARAEDGGPESFQLSRSHHLQQLRRAIRSCNAALVVLDPISAYLGDVNAHQDANVRSVLKPLAAVAADTGATVLWIRHLRKSSAARAMYRAGGSIAFIAASRSSFLVGSDPNSPEERALVHIKSSYGPLTDPVGFTVEGGRFGWKHSTELTAAKILAEDEDADSVSKRQEAEQFLKGILQGGPQPAEAVKKEATALGISGRTLRRARETLDVVWERKGFGPEGTVYWFLPVEKEAANSEEETAPNPATDNYGVEVAQDPESIGSSPYLSSPSNPGQLCRAPDSSSMNRAFGSHTRPNEKKALVEDECSKCAAFLAPWNEECPECGADGGEP